VNFINNGFEAVKDGIRFFSSLLVQEFIPIPENSFVNRYIKSFLLFSVQYGLLPYLEEIKPRWGWSGSHNIAASNPAFNSSASQVVPDLASLKIINMFLFFFVKLF
jgi:hypothetical protein